jgi:hypothetical protein
VGQRQEDLEFKASLCYIVRKKKTFKAGQKVPETHPVPTPPYQLIKAEHGGVHLVSLLRRMCK